MTASIETSDRLGIFVSHASACLTDHMPHGDGLICHSLLDGLARRGHEVFAYTTHAAIRDPNPRLHVKVQGHRSPADSLGGWEHLWRADRWLRDLIKTERIDLTWRMHPFGAGCPGRPPTAGRPLVIGPLFKTWPQDDAVPVLTGRPRFGFGIGKYLQPMARRGWERALRSARIILCATPQHAREMGLEYPNAEVLVTPVIVDPPPTDAPRARWAGEGPFRLIFVANLILGKKPRLFCEIIGELRRRGIDAEGTIIGDGPEREAVELLIAGLGLGEKIRLLGQVPNPAVFDHVRSSHLLVSAYIGEAYGRGIAEAMAVGTPCICHRSGGPTEFITDGEDGLLVGDATAQVYADLIQLVAAEPARWEILASGTARTAANWQSDVVLSGLERIFLKHCREPVIR